MPIKQRMRKTGNATSVERNRPDSGGADISTYDGAANTNAGSVPAQRLEIEGEPAVVATG